MAPFSIASPTNSAVLLPLTTVCDQVRLLAPVAEVMAELVLLEAMASRLLQAFCPVWLIATLASMLPVAYSRFQSPPSFALPVWLSLAATSAPVSRASAFINAWPSALAATSQP